jgi:TolB-like protein/Flp pilus assembly protein TadD
MLNKLSQFWQELKRRKVVRVITVYAAAAFVILELVDIITEPFGLPEWTMILVVVLLCIGLIIAVILSWIYDIHPEGGIVKTKPVHKVTPGEEHAGSNSWRIASYISFVVIVGLIVLNILPRKEKKEILEKSIAVLPFRNDSPEQERMYFINGTMEAILDNLSKIHDMRVVSRNSTEQYRNNPKPTPVVADEMKVSYILEGSGHRDGENVRVIVQLLDGKQDKHIWSKTYDADIEEIFTMQSEIAQMVAQEIEAVITPVEKDLIEKIPTTNLTAYDYYQRGFEELYNWWDNQDDRSKLFRAEEMLNKAILYDSTYAEAYTKLAYVYWNKHDVWEIYSSEILLDSILSLIEIALSYDKHSSDAFEILGSIYWAIGNFEKAIENLNKAIEYNPNYWEPYWDLGHMYSAMGRYELALINFYKATNLHRGKFLSETLIGIGNAFRFSGFEKQAKEYFTYAFELERDTSVYLYTQYSAGIFTEKFEESIIDFEDAYAKDSTDSSILMWLGIYYMMIEQYDKSLKYYNKYLETINSDNLDIHDLRQIGYVNWQMGNKDKAEYYLNESINKCEELKTIIPNTISFHIDLILARLYAFLGDKNKAYDHLRSYNQLIGMSKWEVSIMHNDPMFNSIRDEPEFQQIVRDVESKYKAEHDRVRLWLEENDML